MREKLRSFFYFLLAVAAVFIVLKTLNWLPFVAQKETMRHYDSLEQVRTALDLKEIYVPAYYPQNITWPPSEILAQAKPDPAVVMVYRQAGSGAIMLIVTQAVAANFPVNAAISIDRLTEKVPYPLKGRNALLEVGSCKTGETCSRIAWNEGEFRITVAMRSSPFELIKISESMIH